MATKLPEIVEQLVSSLTEAANAAQDEIVDSLNEFVEDAHSNVDDDVAETYATDHFGDEDEDEDEDTAPTYKHNQVREYILDAFKAGRDAMKDEVLQQIDEYDFDVKA